MIHRHGRGLLANEASKVHSLFMIMFMYNEDPVDHMNASIVHVHCVPMQLIQVLALILCLTMDYVYFKAHIK